MRVKLLCFVLLLTTAAYADPVFTVGGGSVDLRYHYNAGTLSTSGTGLGIFTNGPTLLGVGWGFGTGSSADLILTNLSLSQSIFVLLDFAHSPGAGNPWYVRASGVNNTATDPVLLDFLQPSTARFDFTAFGTDTTGDYADYTLRYINVPEPAALFLMMTGLVALTSRRRKLPLR